MNKSKEAQREKGMPSKASKTWGNKQFLEGSAVIL